MWFPELLQTHPRRRTRLSRDLGNFSAKYAVASSLKQARFEGKSDEPDGGTICPLSNKKIIHSN